MTKQRFIVTYPSGNTTAILPEAPQGNLKRINRQIIDTWQGNQPNMPSIEQCGFLSNPHSKEAITRLEMFGHEFCGNAARSALWLATKGKDYTGYIEIAGTKQPLACSVSDGQVTVEIPLLAPPEQNDNGIFVQLSGIVHCVVIWPDNMLTPRQLLQTILKNSSFANQPAVGVSYFYPDTNRATFCVWVKAVDTMFDETACGSGTGAIGIALALQQRQSINRLITQPSGETIATAIIYENGHVTRSTISGRVEILGQGEIS